MIKKATLVLAILCLMPTISLTIGATDSPRNIILFGWDGAQRDHVKECLNRKELPNLQKIIDEGTFVDIDIEGKTDTKAGWSQIVTGYYPEVTGVYSNQQYQPIPKGLSIFERLETHFGSDQFVTVAVIGKSGNLGTAAPRKVKAPEENHSSQINKTKEGELKTIDTQIERAPVLRWPPTAA